MPRTRHYTREQRFIQVTNRLMKLNKLGSKYGKLVTSSATSPVMELARRTDLNATCNTTCCVRRLVSEEDARAETQISNSHCRKVLRLKHPLVTVTVSFDGKKKKVDEVWH